MSIRKEKIAWFEGQLADFFAKAGREHLPWRKHRISAYEVWVSEIMLQQTQVVRVIGYYTKFLGRFPTIETLAKASWEEFLPYYEGLGYYNRGRNMLRAAEVIVSEYGGRFPRDRELLEKIPGIGPYTAAAIMSFAYGDNHLAWDTNLYRVIGRFFYGTKNFLGHSERGESLPARLAKAPSKRAGRQESRQNLTGFLPASWRVGMTIQNEAFWEDKFVMSKKAMNAALMDFGSALCTARPKCEACSLKTRCVYYKDGGAKEMKDKGCKISDKKGKKIDWGEAEAYVFLHENHKQYFSATKTRYSPFILPTGYATRSGIKKHFVEKYGLTLSVRPPHGKMMIKGKPVFLVNAQILLGDPAFVVFPKRAVEGYNESIKS